MTTPQDPRAEIIPEGQWVDGKFISPEGWPEGAGWVVRDGPDGPITQWGPATDLLLVATTDAGNEGPLPDAAALGVALKGIPHPADEGE